MRDLRKIKSKYEFKLDNKQIAFLLIGVLVVLVVVFALGVVVGKGLVQIQSIEAGLPQTMTPPPNEIGTVPDMLTPEPTPYPSGPEDEGYVNILTGGPTPEPVVENDYPDIPDPTVESQTPEPTPEPMNAPPGGGDFTIQLSSHPSKEVAQQKKSEYEAKGLTSVYIISAPVKGQTWYRVRTGAFATKEGAQQFANAIKAKSIVSDAWVTKK